MTNETTVEPQGIEVLEIGDRRVSLDPNNLRFDEATLTTYIQREGGYYDNFGAMLAYAERALQRDEIVYERVRNERFIEAKDAGAAVALAEAKADVDPIVCELYDRVVESKYKVSRLKRHLYAWDKNHDNAQSLGHMIRKEMDKLHGDIKMRGSSYDDFHNPGRHDVAGEDAQNMVTEMDVERLKAEANRDSQSD